MSLTVPETEFKSLQKNYGGEKLRKLFLFILFLCIFSSTVFGLTPKDNFYVNDYVGILSKEKTDDMIRRAELLREENGSQVVVVIVDNYIGESIESYANEVFNDFGIGSKNDDNGILLMLAINDRKVWIEVGDGMTGQLPNSKTGRILDEYFIPSAKNNDFATAVYDTFLELANNASRLTTQGVLSSNAKSSGLLGWIFDNFLQIFIVVMIIWCVIYNRRTNISRQYNGGGFGGFGNSGGFGGYDHHHHHRHYHNNNSGHSGSSSGHNQGGGGSSSGSGAGRSFGGGFGGSGGSRSSGGHNKGGGGSSSGSGAGRSF